MSGTVGIDNSFSGWLHGLAVSRSESEGAYRIAGEDSLSLSASLTGVYPYMRYNLTDRLRVWGTGGFGRGSLRLQGDSLASSSSDLSMALGSVGMSGDIVSAGSSGGLACRGRRMRCFFVLRLLPRMRFRRFRRWCIGCVCRWRVPIS